MGIKVQSDYSDTTLHNIRRLMVNDTEKFRLVNGNTILYAKGKINFNLNWPKDGTGESFGNYDSGRSIIKTVDYFSNFYAFYGEGFYQKRTNNSNEFCKYDNTLSSIVQNAINYFINHPYQDSVHSAGRDYVLTFKGWYTSASGGKEINTLEDVQKKTSLFDYQSKDGLPQITLYAHWEVPKYTIRIHNIFKREKYSSFEYDGKTTTKTENIRNVLYRANILEEINKRVSNPKYVTWANNTTLGNKDAAEKLKAGPQKFIGWSRDKDVRVVDLEYKNEGYDYLHSAILGTSKNIEPAYIATPWAVMHHWAGGLSSDNEKHTIDVYPNFQPIVIYPKIKLPNGKIYNGKYYCVPVKPSLVRPEDLSDYCNNYSSSIVGDYGIVPVYSYQWWEYEVEGKTQYYKWRVAKTDNKEYERVFGDSWDEGSIYTSSTTVMQFKKLRS